MILHMYAKSCVNGIVLIAYTNIYDIIYIQRYTYIHEDVREQRDVDEPGQQHHAVTHIFVYIFQFMDWVPISRKPIPNSI